VQFLNDRQFATRRTKYENGRSRLVSRKSPVMKFFRLCVQCQAVAVRMFLCFFRLSILAFEVGERPSSGSCPSRDADRHYAGPLQLTSGLPTNRGLNRVPR